jgi:hypothetical protein
MLYLFFAGLFSSRPSIFALELILFLFDLLRQRGTGPFVFVRKTSQLGIHVLVLALPRQIAALHCVLLFIFSNSVPELL